MKTFLLILIASSFVIKLQAQNKGNYLPLNEDQIYTDSVSTMPVYKGGMDKFYARLKRIPYTFVDRVNNHQGHVTVVMVVEKDGTLTNLKVIHGLSEKQDAEILRVFKSFRQWKPGMQGGKPVRVLCAIPINFELKDHMDNVY
jgi:protein TonB